VAAGLLTALAAVPLAGCASDPQHDIRAAFTDYNAALARKDGRASADLVSADTVRYYQRMRDLALHADRTAMAKEPFVDQLTALSLRADVDAARLRSASGKQLVADAVEKGVINQSSQGASSLGTITVKGEVATAGLQLGPPGSTPYTITFRREHGDWKLDLPSLDAPAERLVAQAIARQKMAPEQFIQAVMVSRLGPERARTIWTPPGG
jgi:hypothetical protein